MDDVALEVFACAFLRKRGEEEEDEAHRPEGFTVKMCKGETKNSNNKNGGDLDWQIGVRTMALKGATATAEKMRQHQHHHPLVHAAARSRTQVWIVRATSTILIWTCVIQLTALGELWGPRVLQNLPSCFMHSSFDTTRQISESIALASDDDDAAGSLALGFHSRKIVRPPKRVYKNNGYLLVSCNGGLNQMRSAICDMVAIARHLNLTLVVPELDKTSFWADPSEFGDIFDVEHFIASLRDEVRIVKELPPKLKRKLEQGSVISMPPVSWSNIAYYTQQILPLIQKHKVLHLNKTDARLANNGLPIEIQKLRCRVNYKALRFTYKIEELGRRLLRMLHKNGRFLVLHLRYEMDMLAFSGCTHGCTKEETEELTRMRYAYPWWKEKVINSELKRMDGLCPLTPEETALVLKALDFDTDMQIYIAAGEIYGGDSRMAPLASAFPKLVRKEMLLNSEDLRPFHNHSSQMAALDYLVSLASDVFVPTYDGNMAKVVEGHRRFLGFRETILLDRKSLVGLLDQYNNGSMSWDEFSRNVKDVHKDRMGSPRPRTVIPERPKEEDYFYSNPYECLPSSPDAEHGSY